MCTKMLKSYALVCQSRAHYVRMNWINKCGSRLTLGYITEYCYLINLVTQVALYQGKPTYNI